MSGHLSLGAKNQVTLQYEHPKWASKECEYICPSCNHDVILRRGEINRAHFAHKASTHPCSFYESPTESQIHRDAKHAMKSILEKGEDITIERKCHDKDCSYIDSFEIPRVTESSKIVLEHKFVCNGRRYADVAYLDNNEIFAIFEILHTHKTKEVCRNGDWFEIKARDVINSDGKSLRCQRKFLCPKCSVRYEKAHQVWIADTFDRLRKHKEEEDIEFHEELQKLREAELNRRHEQDMQAVSVSEPWIAHKERPNIAEWNEKLIQEASLNTCEVITEERKEKMRLAAIRNEQEKERREIMQKIKTYEQLMDRERRDQLRRDNPVDYDSDYEQDYRIPKRWA